MKNNLPSESLLRAGFVILLAYGIFNASNFLYHFFSARFLGPEEYSIVASLFSIVYLVSIITVTIQNTVTKFTAGFNAKGENGKIYVLFKKGLKKLFVFSAIFFIVYIIISPLIANFLKIPLISVLILSPFMIFSVLMPLNRGILQGMQKFNSLGINMITEGIIKLSLAVILILIGLKANGAISAVIIASAAAFLLTFPAIKLEKPRKKDVKIDSSKIYQFSMMALTALLLVTAIYNIDIFLVKHFFSAEQAGHYAALALLGKIIFFGTTAIGMVMFPKISELNNHKKSKKVFKKSMIFALIIGGAINAVYFLFSSQLVSLIFGAEYLDIVPMLGFFGIFMLLLSFSYICVLNKLALGKKKFIIFIALAVISEIILISLFHSSLQQIITILMILNALLLFLLLK